MFTLLGPPLFLFPPAIIFYLVLIILVKFFFFFFLLVSPFWLNRTVFKILTAVCYLDAEVYTHPWWTHISRQYNDIAVNIYSVREEKKNYFYSKDYRNSARVDRKRLAQLLQSSSLQRLYRLLLRLHISLCELTTSFNNLQ